MNSLTLTKRRERSAGYVESLVIKSNENGKQAQGKQKPKDEVKKSEEEFSKDLNGESSKEMEPEIRTDNEESIEYQDDAEDDELILVDGEGEGMDDIVEDEADASDKKDVNSANSEPNMDAVSQEMSDEKGNQEGPSATLGEDGATRSERRGVLLVLNEDGQKEKILKYLNSENSELINTILEMEILNGIPSKRPVFCLNRKKRVFDDAENYFQRDIQIEIEEELENME